MLSLEIHDTDTLWALWCSFVPMFTSHISTFVGCVLALSAARIGNALEMRAGVESQCASPFSADLQPLSCSSHDGGTSVKDVKRLSILKLASVFNWGIKSVRDGICNLLLW